MAPTSPCPRMVARALCAPVLLLLLIVPAAALSFAQAKPAAPQAPASPAKGGIAGEVFDKSGTPLAGAEIKWTAENAKEPGTVTTDARGAFNIPKLEPGKYVLTITARGCLPKTQKVNVKGGGTAKVHIRLKSPPSPKPSSM
ncbi:MAG TPA: carboxypeptidase-like regulatory domain-containing protein [Candidatus Sulfotelmatobacter sp.]|nr:carboxypeptidase-like regulatory domain-containing protein [Candidatus Sulfotelmatobacter sp.]